MEQAASAAKDKPPRWLPAEAIPVSLEEDEDVTKILTQEIRSEERAAASAPPEEEEQREKIPAVAEQEARGETPAEEQQ